jgi:hypothetical protein
MSDDSDDPQPKRMVYEMRERVQRARNIYWEEGVDGHRSTQTKKRLAAVTIQYWDVLFEFREESVLEEGDFPDISRVRSRIGETTDVPAAAGGRSRGGGTKTVPAIAELSADELLELTERLDDLANKLGFGAATASGKGDIYAIKRDPEDYSEPVNDDIPKPQ